MRAFNHENRALTPGKFLPSDSLGYIQWLEQEKRADFEVLCGYNCIWVPACDRQIPVGAIEGGHLQNKDYKYYVGRAFEDGYLIPGKVMATHYHPVCYITYNGRKIAKKNYEILVDPEISLRTNRYLITHMENLAENRPKADSDDAYLLALRDNDDDEDTSESEQESE
uniref:Uncharacterized protein n=3 Tax=Pararge aegeria TaxID=116150 RepID=S4P901_9NEOP